MQLLLPTHEDELKDGYSLHDDLETEIADSEYGDT
jgi:hypothetical protein